jgi:hypothetical protein
VSRAAGKNRPCREVAVAVATPKKDATTTCWAQLAGVSVKEIATCISREGEACGKCFTQCHLAMNLVPFCCSNMAEARSTIVETSPEGVVYYYRLPISLRKSKLPCFLLATDTKLF